ncbi:double-stranded RNA-specific editase Adar isoform X2 [Anthonomus grandis grandis]|uniref:double-stranded RNA-specific editase Adar isoform X2 n=1 Tax=Anthonomus grandis grandis TaxID=2921223 RepID=UPI002165D340|nr:double-stranded RNA-specific editase Adar isoform X2 [Anthonomus grandis grandis]
MLSGTQQKHQPQQPARTPQQPQQSGINFRQQQQQQTQQQTQQNAQQNFASTPQQAQQRAPQIPIKQEPKVQPKPVTSTPVPAAQPPAAPPAPVVSAPAASAAESAPAPTEPVDVEMGGERKKFWIKSKAGKISRSEKIRRRNLKLSKILQPKNAVMILNELVKGCVYNVEEVPVKIDGNTFRGTVTFDDQEFVGAGRTKSAAKNAAAETALKHIIKNKQVPSLKKDDPDGDEKMDTGEEDSTQVMPWSHIASFAMYKLFSMWGEDPNLVNRVSPQDVQGQAAAATTAALNKSAEKAALKPSKKMPENPEKMNPLQLMHQMFPNAVWEEIGKSGNPPNVVFTFGLSVEGKQFQGTGASKKIAKRLAAFAACHDLLGVLYPPDVWAPMY